MIDVKIIKKPKNKATTPTVRTPGAAYGDKSVKEAVHASKADTAKMAEKAIIAEQAEHAKKADEATRADEVSFESKTLTHFLRNDIPNTAAEVVTFLKGVISKAVSFFQGIVNKGDINNDGNITNIGNINNEGDINNSGNVTTKNLTVTGKATFFELEIEKAKAAGGMLIQTAGNFKADFIKEVSDGWELYQKATDDTGKTVMQTLEAGDQVFCAQFNLQEHGKGNRYYWRRVIEAPTEHMVVQGIECIMIKVSKTDAAPSSTDEPRVGDTMILLGSKNKGRQAAQISSSYNSLDPTLKAPYWAQYDGIDDWRLDTHKKSWFAANGNHLNGSFSIGQDSIEEYVNKQIESLDRVSMFRLAPSPYVINIDDEYTDCSFYVIKQAGDVAEVLKKAVSGLKINIVVTAEKTFAFSYDKDYDVGQVIPGVLLRRYGAICITAKLKQQQNDGSWKEIDSVLISVTKNGEQGVPGEKGDDGESGKDAVAYKLIPVVEYAYIAGSKRNSARANVSLRYKVQKSVGETVVFVNPSDEGLTLSNSASLRKETDGTETWFAYNGLYSNLGSEVQITVTLSRGNEMFDVRVVNLIFKPSVMFDIDQELGTVTSDIETLDGKHNTLKQTIDALSSEVANKASKTQIRQTAEEIALEVVDNSKGRQNLLVGSAFRTESEVVLNNPLLPCVISRNINYQGTNSIKIEATSSTAAYKGIAFKDIALKAGQTYNLSFWAYREEAEVGYAAFEVDAYKVASDGNNKATWFRPLSNLVSFEAPFKWKLNAYDFTPSEDTRFVNVLFWIEKSGLMYIARPMLKEGAGYRGWSLNEKDENYLTKEDASRAGLNITSQGVELFGEKVQIRNSDGRVSAMFENGKIKSEYLQAKEVSADMLAQPFERYDSLNEFITGKSLSWVITDSTILNGKRLSSSPQKNGVILNIFNQTTTPLTFSAGLVGNVLTASSYEHNSTIVLPPYTLLRMIGIDTGLYDEGYKANIAGYYILTPYRYNSQTKVVNIRNFNGAIPGHDSGKLW